LKKYNLLILTPDQYRADYIGCYGHKTIGTTNLDSLASEGVLFERCYCSAPLCGPSRISFTTSMRLSEHGRRNYWSCIDYNVPNLVNTLKNSGYRTSMFGKNHLFLYDQLGDAWDELHEICLGNYDEHPKYTRSYSAFELEKDHRYNVTSLLADEAVDFIQRSGDEQPFFCWVNWQDPHPAYICPEPYASMFNPDDMVLPANWGKSAENKPKRLENWRINSLAHECSEQEAKKAMAMYMGQCRYVDDQVGKIMKCLKEAGKLENTIVLFFSDHGELVCDFGAFHKIPVFYECLTRIPVIVRYPKGMAKPFRFKGLVEEVDLVPTIFEAMGITIPQSMAGASWHSEIVKGIGKGRESVLVEAGLQIPTADAPVYGANHRAPKPPNSFGPGAMVTDGRYKLSMYYDDNDELYDLQDDPCEIVNLYGKKEYKQVQDRLTTVLVRRLLSVGVRAAGAWKGPGIDVRYNPPESRDPRREMPEMFIKKPVIMQKEE
jgi:arylsulfatase A-like enzyme